MNNERLKLSLKDNKINKIRKSILNTGKSNSIVQYRTDFFECNLSKDFDMIFSQACMEHVEELRKTYKLMSNALNKSGFISHQIDFKSHATSKTCDGHWKYNSFIWKIINGNRNWNINRMPFSSHLHFLEENNFKNIKSNRDFTEPTFNGDQLAKEFFLISELDRSTSGGFIQAMKK